MGAKFASSRASSLSLDGLWPISGEFGEIRCHFGRSAGTRVFTCQIYQPGFRTSVHPPTVRRPEKRNWKYGLRNPKCLCERCASSDQPGVPMRRRGPPRAPPQRWRLPTREAAAAEPWRGLQARGGGATLRRASSRFGRRHPEWRPPPRSGLDKVGVSLCVCVCAVSVSATMGGVPVCVDVWRDREREKEPDGGGGRDAGASKEAGGLEQPSRRVLSGPFQTSDPRKGPRALGPRIILVGSSFAGCAAVLLNPGWERLVLHETANLCNLHRATRPS